MAELRVVWSHGKDSPPWGAKSTILAEVAKRRGLEMEALDYRGAIDPDVRVGRLVDHCQAIEGPVALVGSSMGGYASVAAAALEVRARGVFVLAPALYLPGYRWQDFPGLRSPVTVVHGWRDELVPVEHILRFGGVHRCSLHVFDSDHRLIDKMEEIGALFDGFLARAMAG